MKVCRYIALLLVAVLLSTLLVSPALADQTADTVYVRKHISLLYDNSGSMSQKLEKVDNLKWSYASYAAQMFASLLNDTDSLSFTFMNETNSMRKLEVDLTADRQGQVDKILKATNFAKGGTPIESIEEAKKTLVEKGLRSDSQMGNDPIDKSQQYWLVLTTDGNFQNTSSDQLVERLEKLLQEYSNLQVVYFGIGTEGDNSDEAALNLKGNKTLAAYPNFTAVYAEKQDQILETMQMLANRISGRYSVSSGMDFDGSKVSIRVSGETSPIRNIGLLAQNTNASLVRATTEDGSQLTVSRTSSIQYPNNTNYDRMPAGTKGGHTALITSSDGKIPSGTIVLEFSEPVDKNNFSLMYEPAIYVDLTLQYQDDAGNWVDVPYGEKVLAEQDLRVNYVICEDGTNTPIDTTKLPGTTTARIVCGNTAVDPGKAFRLPEGSTTIRAEVSMMDGAYVVSAVRNVTVHSLSGYTFQVSDPLEFYPDQLAENTDAYVEITVLYNGKTPTAGQLADLRLDTGDLQGETTNPGTGIYRFTPRQTDCPVGDYTVRLLFQDQTVASQTVLVKESVITYSAQAGDPLALFNNQLTTNTTPIVFQVTRHRDEEAIPLAQADAGEFRIEAVSANGLQLNGQVSYQPDGQLCFVPDDPNGAVGDYSVILYWKDQELARSGVTVMQYNAKFTIEVFRTGDETVDRLNLRKNTDGLAFVVRADGVVVTAAQLEAMLGQQLLLTYTPEPDYMQMDIRAGEYEGQPALIVTPGSTARTGFGALIQKPFIFLRGGVVTAFNNLVNVILMRDVGRENLEVTLTVEAVNGAAKTGTLELYNDPLQALICVIALLFLIALGLYIVVVIWINRTKPRISPGTFYYFHIEWINGVPRWNRNIPPVKHRRKVYWIKRQPEVVSLSKKDDKKYFPMTFRAENGKRGDTKPRALLDTKELDLYTYASYSNSKDSKDRLEYLRRAKQPTTEDLENLTKAEPVLDPDMQIPKTDKFERELQNGGFIVRTVKKLNDNNKEEYVSMDIWLYFMGG